MREGGVKSAQRAMELLEFFADWRRPASVKEISQSLGYPQSSTSMLLSALAEAGYYDHDPRTAMYAPSVRILLAAEWIGEQLFSEQSLLRLMEQVHRPTGHTVMIGAQHGVHVRYLHVLQATREGSFTAKTGSLRPLFRSATGKMLLTLKTEREVALLLRRANALETDRKLALDLPGVLRERETNLRNGYAMSTGTSVPGAGALAILLPVARGAKPMTLSVGGPVKEITREKTRLLRILHDAVAPMLKIVSQ
ncbi:ArsR family transcriptional regulator [Ramlibacter henchirensis]|uniref:ArsR family transcriptional regulator n=1 Tax=Ramlibacter henchirensis TaxID=204072 RepID=A0A4Z0BVG3_9BURK|nr:helix-turn-helix domain-containing protein [Ramlibacter henchirensis]TFZ02692.1 ArsR family transcriptional regulator [Ramlibacter henchirensis]